MTRPSEPLLRWLREQIDARGHNTASVAAKLGAPRAHVRKVLAGAEPLMVDELLVITELLGLSAEDMGVPAGVEATAEDLAEGEATEPEAVWDNQPRALFELGFDLGIDFMFLADTRQLADWGGPDGAAKQYDGKDMPLQLDAAYHPYMEPALDDEGVSLTLSFDRLYRCTFPWTAIRRVIFTPLAPDVPPPEPEADDDDAPEPGGAPFLRLVR